MGDRDRSDWVALVLVILVFVALGSVLFALGTGSEIPFLERLRR